VHNACLGHNNQAAALTIPLLLMDVYEHAYVIDYGAKLKDYIEAFFNNINWEAVEKRFEATLKLPIM
jgi:superoxide dismutase, Fe-Mn family